MSTATASKRTPWEWAAIFGVYSVVVLSGSESGDWGEAVTALAWLVFLGAAVYWWNPLTQHLGQLTGVGLTPA